jgi:quercetin dioxygenase-like cupin family protein
MSQPLVIRSNEQPAPLKLVGEELTILASGTQTGSYEIFRQYGPEGAGPPPHQHGWDEAFYVLAGGVTFGLEDGDEVLAEAGTFVHVPGGTMHWFRFAPGGGEMLSVTSRAGASAFFTQVDAEVAPADPDLGALVAIATSHGLTIPPPPG